MDRNEDVTGWETDRLQEFVSLVSAEHLAAYHDPDRVQEKLAAWLEISSDSLCITAGSSEALQMVFDTYVEEGGNVISLEPSYGLYDVFTAKCGADRIGLSFEEDLSFSLRGLLEAISRTRASLVVIANPNQPTGTFIDLHAMRSVASATLATNSILLVDEAYFLFSPESAIVLLNEFPNVVVTQTFSKALGLAGVRFGYVASNPERIKEIAKMRPLTQSNSLALLAAEYVLDNMVWAMKRVDDSIAGRDFLIRKLRSWDLKVYDSHTNFVLLDCASVKDAADLVRECRQTGYAIRGPLEVYPLRTCVRITAGPEHLARRFLSENAGSIRRYGQGVKS